MTDHGWHTVRGQVPSKSNSYRVVTINGHGSLAKTPATKRYEDAFYLQVGDYRNLKIQGLFELHVRVYFTSLAHDLDNSLKVLLDCLQHCGAIRNDNRCVRIVADKYLDKANPRVEFCIVEM